jgi:arginase
MASPEVLVVPQWQGSISPEAGRMAAGAAQLAELAAAAGAVPRTVGGLPQTRSPVRDGVSSLDQLLAARARIAAELAALDSTGRPVLAIGGDCAADLAVAAAGLERRGGDLALLWIDAHADFNSPATSPSGAFHGMVTRCLTGVGPAGMLPAVPAAPGVLVLTGTRSVDPAEQTELEAAGVQQVGMRAFGEPEAAVAALLQTGCSAVHVHLDLDVLDPQVFPDTVYRVPGGATVEQVLALLTTAGAALPVASAFVGEHLGGDKATTRHADPLVRRLLAMLSTGA